MVMAYCLCMCQMVVMWCLLPVRLGCGGDGVLVYVSDGVDVVFVSG